MRELQALLDRLEQLLSELDELEEPTRALVYELLDGVDMLHRAALTRLGEDLDPEQLRRLRDDPLTGWLLEAYGVGVDGRELAENALAEIRPYIHSHGGEVHVLEASAGVVHVRMTGACAGCTASAVTLRHGVEEALAQGYPGFVRLEVTEEDAPAHPPPGQTLLQIQDHPPPGM